MSKHHTDALEWQSLVLVVEDDPLVRLVTEDVLIEAGFRVIEVPNADDALIELEARPDIRFVVTDVGNAWNLEWPLAGPSCSASVAASRHRRMFWAGLSGKRRPTFRGPIPFQALSPVRAHLDGAKHGQGRDFQASAESCVQSMPRGAATSCGPPYTQSSLLIFRSPTRRILLPSRRELAFRAGSPPKPHPRENCVDAASN